MTRLCHHITSSCTQRALTVSFAIIDRGWKTSYGKAIFEYGNLSEHELSGWELQQDFIYGNGEVQSVQNQRAHLCQCTSHPSLLLNLHTMLSIGMMKRQMNEAGWDLKEPKLRSMALQRT